MSLVYAADPHELVTRTYTVGIRCLETTPHERRQQEIAANQIIGELQRSVREKITVPAIQTAYELLRQQPQLHGTHGAAILADRLEDRSNLGQVACLTVLNAMKGALDREAKLQQFRGKLVADFPELVTWFVFGRTPWVEKQLTTDWQLSYDYVRNLIVSARRCYDQTLVGEQQLTAPLPTLTNAQFVAAFEQFTTQKRQAFAQITTAGGTLTAGQLWFQARLAELEPVHTLVAEQLVTFITLWNHQESRMPHNRWKWLKQVTAEFTVGMRLLIGRHLKDTAYFSIMRGVLATALCASSWAQTVSALVALDTTLMNKLHRKPFSRSTTDSGSSAPIPLALLMGAKYVVSRPGNSEVLTQLAITQKEFTLEIYRPRDKRHAIHVRVRIHPKLRAFLCQGAKIQLLTLLSGTAPAWKIRVQITCQGPRHAFISRTSGYTCTDEVLPLLAPLNALGVDLNRVGDDVIALSELIPLSPEIVTLCVRYHNLTEFLGHQHQLYHEARQWVQNYPSVWSYRYATKQFTELDALYARRSRLVRQLCHRLSYFLSDILDATHCQLLCVEDLQLTTRGHKGAVARAIASMPRDQDIFHQAILRSSMHQGHDVLLVYVDPTGTSHGVHATCSVSPPGHPQRSSEHWDWAPCSACGQLLNTHVVAALTITERGLQVFRSSSSYLSSRRCTQASGHFG